jgi:hypothetical protein
MCLSDKAMGDAANQSEAVQGKEAPSVQLTERLLRRSTQPIGLVNVNHPQHLYDGTIGWVARRFSLLDRWKTRYGSEAETGENHLVFASKHTQSLETVQDGPNFAPSNYSDRPIDFRSAHSPAAPSTQSSRQSEVTTLSRSPSTQLRVQRRAASPKSAPVNASQLRTEDQPPQAENREPVSLELNSARSIRRPGVRTDAAPRGTTALVSAARSRSLNDDPPDEEGTEFLPSRAEPEIDSASATLRTSVLILRQASEPQRASDAAPRKDALPGAPSGPEIRVEETPPLPTKHRSPPSLPRTDSKTAQTPPNLILRETSELRTLSQAKPNADVLVQNSSSSKPPASNAKEARAMAFEDRALPVSADTPTPIPRVDARAARLPLANIISRRPDDAQGSSLVAATRKDRPQLVNNTSDVRRPRFNGPETSAARVASAVPAASTGSDRFVMRVAQPEPESPTNDGSRAQVSFGRKEKMAVPEIPVSSSRTRDQGMVWRRPTDGSQSSAQPVSSRERVDRTLPLLVSRPLRSIENVVHRQVEEVVSDHARSEPTPDANGVASERIATHSGSIDLTQLAALVSRLLSRQLAVERERRGINGWR